PGNDESGRLRDRAYAGHELIETHEKELGITMVPFQRMVYLEDKDSYVPEREARSGSRILDISKAELRALLDEGREIPSWFTFPEVAHELQRNYPSRGQQGFTVFFTGLSGSGKSTVASALLVKLLEMGSRR